MRRNRGFALVSAIFILVVLALAATLMINIAQSTSNTTTWGLNGARAYFAANTGVEWGAMQIVKDPSGCFSPNPATLNLSQAGLAGFSVNIACTMASYTENDQAVDIFTVTATASQNTIGTADYVRRTIETTVTVD